MLVLEKPIVKSRDQQITQWYEEVFPVAARYIHKRGGDIETARDLFQEALIVYYEKLTNGSFQPQVSDKAYLTGIVKKLWLKHLEQQKPMEDIDQVEVREDDQPKTLDQKLLSFLQLSGEKCMNLLQSFYYEKLNMKQVSERFGFASERSATVQKYKCLEKVREEVKQKSLCYEDFLD